MLPLIKYLITQVISTFFAVVMSVLFTFNFPLKGLSKRKISDMIKDIYCSRLLSDLYFLLKTFVVEQRVLSSVCITSCYEKKTY